MDAQFMLALERYTINTLELGFQSWPLSFPPKEQQSSDASSGEYKTTLVYANITCNTCNNFLIASFWMSFKFTSHNCRVYGAFLMTV